MPILPILCVCEKPERPIEVRLVFDYLFCVGMKGFSWSHLISIISFGHSQPSESLLWGPLSTQQHWLSTFRKPPGSWEQNLGVSCAIYESLDLHVFDIRHFIIFIFCFWQKNIQLILDDNKLNKQMNEWSKYQYIFGYGWFCYCSFCPLKS